MYKTISKIAKKSKCTDKIQNQIASVAFLFKHVTKLRETINEYILKSSDYEEDLIMQIRQVSAEIYSWCDISNELLISLFHDDIRYRGTNLNNGFNTNFKKICQANISNLKLSGVHSDKSLTEFYTNAMKWFLMIHDIRTQETHYEVGKINIIDGKLKYCNNNRNGVSKLFFSNPSNFIELELTELITFIDLFLEQSYELCSIVELKLS